MSEETKTPTAEGTPEVKKDSLAEARALLVAEEQKAREAFAIEINEVCKKHGFNLQIKAEIVAVKV